MAAAALLPGVAQAAPERGVCPAGMTRLLSIACSTGSCLQYSPDISADGKTLEAGGFAGHPERTNLSC